MTQVHRRGGFREEYTISRLRRHATVGGYQMILILVVFLRRRARRSDCLSFTGRLRRTCGCCYTMLSLPARFVGSNLGVRSVITWGKIVWIVLEYIKSVT